MRMDPSSTPTWLKQSRATDFLLLGVGAVASGYAAAFVYASHAFTLTIFCAVMYIAMAQLVRGDGSLAAALPRFALTLVAAGGVLALLHASCMLAMAQPCGPRLRGMIITLLGLSVGVAAFVAAACFAKNLMAPSMC